MAVLGEIRSASLEPNALFDIASGNAGEAIRQNALLTQQKQQAIGAQELEVGARVASALLTLPAEQRAEAYPKLVGLAQAQGYMKQAPPSYPGDDHARALAQMGVPSEKLYGERANLTANAAIWPPRGATPGAAAAPGAGTGTPAAPGQIEQPAQERARAVYDGLIKRGMDHETATGFAANALHESAANPNTGTGDAGASHGLFQWTRDRYDAYIAKNGHPPDRAPLDEQLDFVMHELGGSESLARGRIAAAQGPEGKAAEISQAYLRPKDTVPEMQRRAATARQLAGLWTPNATAQQGDEAWLTEMAKRYPAMAGPNTNVNQPAMADQAAAGGPAIPAPYQVAGAPVGASAAAPAPAAPPTTPAPTAQATPPAAPAPAAPAIPPPAQRTATGYTTEQNAVLDAMARNPRTTSEALRAQMNTFNDDNRALDAQHLAAQNQAQTGQRSDQAAAALAEQRRLENERAQAAATAAAEQHRIQNEAATAAAKRDEMRLSIEQRKLEQGSSMDERDQYNLRTEDPSSQKYADSYISQKWKIAPNGNVIEQNMSRYPAPTRSIQRPTYLPAPTPQALDEVRKADTDAKVITSALDHYNEVFTATGGKNWGAYFDDPTSPQAQQLLGAFDRLKTVLRSPVYYNTGVLQPAEMELLKQDLVSPKSLRGLFATPQALASRLGEIKLAILTRQDAELRSIGKDGVIVRDAADFANVKPGAKYYDESGNLRVKPGQQ